MATQLYTDVAGTSGQSGVQLSDRQDSEVVCGVVLIATATYTFTGAEVATNVINIVELPAGAVVIPHLSRVTGSASIASTLTISIGNADGTPVATKFSSALSMQNSFDAVLTGGTASLTPYTLTAQSFITATLTTASTITAGKVLVFRIAYKVS
jgi:hypothetical protein